MIIYNKSLYKLPDLKSHPLGLPSSKPFGIQSIFILNLNVLFYGQI